MRRAFPLICSALLWLPTVCLASVTGSISGVVTDSTGSVIQRAKVGATNSDTGISNSTITNSDGSYSFPNLPIGHYSVRIEASGFSEFTETNIVLDVNTALRMDARLQVSSVAQSVDVSANAVQVDTISTQMGDVIGSTAMTSIPLNGRSTPTFSPFSLEWFRNQMKAATA